MKIKCPQCGKTCDKYAGHVNRSRAMGLNIYCSRKCAGLGRRTNETEEEKKAIKYYYDSLLHFAFYEQHRKKKAEAFKKDYAANPEKYRRKRKERQSEHNEYCRQPKYKKWKKEYDQQYRAKKHYGKFWESSIYLRQLADIVDNRQAKADQKNITKSQKRKRNAKNTQRKELESCPVGLH